MIRPIFWNAEQRRLRAPWRLLIFLGIAAAVANPLVLALDAAGSSLLESALVNPIVALAFFLALLVNARYIDRRPLRDFGLGASAAWWRDLGVGFAVGAAMMCALFLAAWLGGWVEVRGVLHTEVAAVPFAVAFLGQLARYAAGSFFEELMSRSYLLRVIAEGAAGGRIGRKQALLIGWVGTSLLFGGLHLANPNATMLGALNITMLGILFGLGMVYTGSLALPIGMHMAWNVFQNNVFGLPNSGKPATTSLLVTEPGGPAWWAGGAFGPEGGLLSLGAVALGGVLIWRLLRRRYGGPALQLTLADAPPNRPLDSRGKPGNEA